MKTQKRILSLTLALVMALTLLPTGAFAQEEVALSREEMFARIPVSSVRRPQNFLEAELATGINDMTCWEQNATEAEREAIFQEVVSLTDRLVSGKTSETEKVKAIYQWVRTNVSYDWGELHGINYISPDYNDGLFAYSTGYAVCWGYSRLCHLMLNLAGLSGAMVTSYDLAHMWNAAYADGKWITFDATQSKWDDSRHIDYIEYYDNKDFLYTFFDDGVVWYSWAGTKDTCPEVLVIPDGVTKLKSFECNENLTSVVIPGSVTTIDEAFSGCKNLASVTILDGVTGINAYAFGGCDRLTSVVLPASIADVNFQNCKNLTDIYYVGSQEQWTNVSFDWNDGTNGSTKEIDGKVNIRNRGDRTFLVIGEMEVDITDTWEREGKYRYEGDGFLITAEKIEKGHSLSLRPYKRKFPGQVHYNYQPITVPTPPAEPVPLTADPTNDALTVDGKSATPTAYKIGGANYFPLRDVAMLLSGTKAQFSVEYDGEHNAVKLTTGKAYTPQGWELAGAASQSQEAIVGNDSIYINGEKADFTVFKIGGSNFFQIRDLGKALGFNVGWTAEKGMFIESDKPYDPNN